MGKKFENPPFTFDDAHVQKLKGRVGFEGFETARRGAEKFRKLLSEPGFVRTFGALTGSQAVQMVRGGLKAIYVSGWQVAADMNIIGETYPDLSLYPANSVPNLVRRINKAFHREEEKQSQKGEWKHDYFVPIVADAEAAFGGNLNAAEIMRWMLEAGASAVHFEDQLSSAKKCGHLGGKVIVPTQEFIEKLKAARLAAQIAGVPNAVIIARTDAEKAKYITSDIDERDRRFLTGKRTAEGFYEIEGGFEVVKARMLAYANYADVLWYETATPDLDDAQEVAEAIHRVHPGKPLAYNCSPSFYWEQYFAKKYGIDMNGDADEIASMWQHLVDFQKKLGELGHKFQFITLAGWHLLNYFTFMFAKEYAQRGMSAYVHMIQNPEWVAEKEHGYEAVRHQRTVGTEYFDAIMDTISGGESSIKAMEGSTEKEQFNTEKEEK